jgi:NRAMP (natural resistance-associated macrophage protein)-like metal ion transporter
MEQKAKQAADTILHKQYSADDVVTASAVMPAIALDKTVQVSNQILHAVPTGQGVQKAKNYWHMLGPGLTTGASDDDPSGIATYSQTGAQFGYHLLWLSAWLWPLAATVQEMCARIGLVTGRGLAGNIRTYTSKRTLQICTFLLFAANAFNIGADLGAMAKGVQLLNSHLNFSLLVIGFAIFSLLLQIFTPYARYARYLKWLAMVLLSYVVSSILAHLNWSNVMNHAIIPTIHWNKNELLIICAILGTTISPYLFFWQTSQEVEEQILQGKTTVKERRSATKPEDVKSMRVDVWSGMFLSEVVMFFIIAACGGVLYSHGITNINSAAQAAEALRPFAGSATYFMFAIGIIGTGMLAIPVLAGSSSYAVAESLGWKEGLYRGLNQAYAFYGIIIISMLVGLGMNFIGLNPIKALIYSAVANGLVAPIILVFIVRISSNKKIMGHWVNHRSTTIVGWLITALMTLSGVAAIYSLF